MAGDSTYNYKGSEKFTIENGVLKGVVVPPTTRHTNYGEWILERLRAQPEFVGQVDGTTGRKETFAEMTEKSVKCAMWLKEQNVKPGDIIGICTHVQMDMYVPCFAALYAGAVFNPWWDVGLNKEMTRHFITLTRPKVLFANAASAGIAVEVAEELGVAMKVVILGKLKGFQSLDEILGLQDSKLVPDFRCTKLSSIDDPALVLYTSGTTGLPKGVLHSHKTLIRTMIVEKLCDTVGTVTTMMFSVLGWATCIIFMTKGVLQPETRVVPPEFSEESTFRLIEQHKVNWLLVAKSSAFRLQKSSAVSRFDISSLKKIVVTGGVLKDETQKAMAATFPRTIVGQAYGSTELGCIVLETEAVSKPGSCGTIVRNFSMKVIDSETGKILGPNQTGEACFKSPYMMTCYYNNPEATRDIFDDEGWLHTGDLVHYDEEGYVFVTDRIKEMIKYRGNHVSPAIIEKVLQGHPEVTEAAVVSIPHDVDDEHPIAFVVTTPTAKVSKTELEKLVADTLPFHMKLRGGVEFMDELPHTSSGKIARAALKKLAVATPGKSFFIENDSDK